MAQNPDTACTLPSSEWVLILFAAFGSMAFAVILGCFLGWLCTRGFR